MKSPRRVQRPRRCHPEPSMFTETITPVDKESAHLREQLAQKYADIVCNGQWFHPRCVGELWTFVTACSRDRDR